MAEDVALEDAGRSSRQLTRHRLPLGALTGIRFFAAFYVVVFHTRTGRTLYDHGWRAAGNFFTNGYLAVPLFFLLSGFILAYTYEGQIERRGDHRRFWEARFARIWPVYAVSLLMASVPGFRLPPVGQAVAALCMVQAWNPWRPELAGTWNLVCWTLSVEALFYLCFPWVQTWLEERSERGQLAWIAAMLLVCVEVNSASRTLGFAAEGWSRWVPLPVLHLPEFFAGVGAGNYYLRRLAGIGAGEKVLRGGGAWTYGAAAATVALLCLPGSRWTSVVVIAFSALLYGLAAERTALSRWLSTKTMLVGGGISYSIYLVQMPVKGWVGMVAERVGLRSEAVRFGVTAVVLMWVSWLLFRTVEDPARKVLRGMFARLETRRAMRGGASESLR